MPRVRTPSRSHGDGELLRSSRWYHQEACSDRYACDIASIADEIRSFGGRRGGASSDDLSISAISSVGQAQPEEEKQEERERIWQTMSFVSFETWVRSEYLMMYSVEEGTEL